MRAISLTATSVVLVLLTTFTSHYARAIDLSTKLGALGYGPLSCLQVQESEYDINSTAVHITFVNDTTQSIKPAWLDKSGKVRLRKTIGAGVTWNERTLAGTVWIWLDEERKECLGTTVIAPAGVQPEVVRISEISASQLSSLQAPSNKRTPKPSTEKPERNPSEAEGGQAKDRAILSAFYSAANGPVWIKSDKWLTDENVCHWHGVTCNKESRRVESLRLRFNNLTGSLPSLIGELDKLETLDLDGNKLYGALPAELNNLKKLRRLDLGKNSFSGRMPSLDRLKKLREFWVNDNEFTGTPPFIIRHANVYSIDISNNAFEGDLRFLPDNETRLRSLKASNNRLSGAIPRRIADMKNLSTFDIANNRFTDLDRAAAERLASVRSVNLGGNKFKCPFPFVLGDIFAESKEFCVGFTRQAIFSGSLQAEYSELSGIGGQWAFKANFVDGERDGLHQRWYPNGQFMLEESYVNGKRHGLWRQWYENGDLRLEKNYKDGKLHGPYFTFKSGNVDGSYCYRNGRWVDVSECAGGVLDTKSETRERLPDSRFVGTYYVNRVQMDGGRASLLRLRQDGSADYYKRGYGYTWEALDDEIVVSYDGSTKFRVRFVSGNKTGETTYTDGSKWNDISLEKLSDSPDYKFDLFMLGTAKGSKDQRCFNIGRGEFPHGTYPWLAQGLPITSRTLEGCESLCPKVLKERRDHNSSSKIRAYWADGTCPPITDASSESSRKPSARGVKSDTPVNEKPATAGAKVAPVKARVTSGNVKRSDVDTDNQRMARIAHELNSNKRSYNALYTLEEVKIDYETQELNYVFNVNSSIDALDLVSLSSTFKQSYCSASKLTLFRQNNVDALWIFEDKTGRSVSIRGSVTEC